MSPELVFQQALNGLSFGALLFILASGLSLVFGMMDVVNLAHGAFYMLGALGVNTNRLFASTFATGAALAGLAGVIAAPVFGVQPGMDTDPGLLYSLVVVVVGGLGTLSGAVAGSVLVGPADTFGKVLFQDVALAVIFAIVALVLLLKPTGLLGRIRIAR